MTRIRALIHRVAPTALPILLQGPTGSGKEMAAKEIHQVSQRSGAFIQFNASGISEGIAESELFGHVRGAFTGAHLTTSGLFAAAHHGTIFLDEIANLSTSIQGKLLRTLDNQEIRAVGATRVSHYDFRPIAATNQDLRRLSDRGQFRDDLYYRLNGLTIHMPPLTDHLEDIPALVSHFQISIHARDNIYRTIMRSAITELQRHPWPGNVRQLYHVLRRIVILAEASVIDAAHVREVLDNEEGFHHTSGASDKEMLLAALRQHGGNVNRTAKHFGVHISTMYRRMRNYGISSRAIPGTPTMNK